MITVKCKVCGKDIYCYESTKNKKVFCSRECRLSETHLVKRCKECDTIYSIAKSRYNGGFDRHKHCSDRCYDLSIRRKKERIEMSHYYTCGNCGKLFKGYRQKKYNLKFCSQKCFSEYSKGSNNPNYIDGTTINTAGFKALIV